MNERHADRQADRAFGALSDATRRRIWLALGTAPGATTSEVAAGIPMVSRWAVMKHLQVLRAAGLVRSLPEGRRRRHYRDERGLAPALEWLREACGG